MIEKYSCYEYEVWATDKDTDNEQNNYTIYLGQNYLGDKEAIESDEWYETEEEARQAAIDHIDRLENGEQS